MRSLTSGHDKISRSPDKPDQKHSYKKKKQTSAATKKKDFKVIRNSKKELRFQNPNETFLLLLFYQSLFPKHASKLFLPNSSFDNCFNH